VLWNDYDKPEGVRHSPVCWGIPAAHVSSRFRLRGETACGSIKSGESFPFRIVYPACGAEVDVDDIGYRLAATVIPQTAALAGERPRT
jgi:hypothetical protein